MNEDKIEKIRRQFYGDSPDRWIALVPTGLNDIGVGLSAVVQAGRRGFRLEGSALIEFIRRALYALVERGAKPRHWGTIENPDRDIPLHYGGDSNSEIVEGVIADWLASGGGDLQWGDFWFDLPKASEKKKI
jgi:hypothetical protein